MNKMIMTLFARTPVHVGAGNSVGAIDSPVMRERHTRIPIIPGSSLKGVLADLWNDEENITKIKRGNREVIVRKKDSEVARLFGQEEYKQDESTKVESSAGSLLIGEARVLAFPVRSAKGMFAWVTCPLVLNRYARDTGCKLPEIDTSALEENSCFASEDILLGDSVILEEYRLKSIDLAETTSELLKPLSSDPVWQEVTSRLVIVSDEMFAYFCENACEVVTRIKVDDDTGTVAGGALFNLEQVPSETLFYAVVFANSDETENPIKVLSERIASENGVIQVGGDATTGLGFCSVKFLNAEVN